MKLIPLALFTAAPLLLPAARSTELVFSPREGSSLTTTHQRVLELELGDAEVTLTLDGEEQEGAEPPDIELVLRETESISFTDDYHQVAGGRVNRLTRSFEEVGTVSSQSVTDPSGETHEVETPGESELESTTVEFRWDEEAEEYTVRFGEDDEELDGELLENLEASADLAAFLPGDAVDEGDTWEIEVAAFSQLSSPSGDLKIVREGEEGQENDFGEQFDDHLEGDLEGEFRGFKSVDGRELAVIRVTGALETYVEQEEMLEGDDGEGTSTETFRFSFDLEGDLLWDAEANHAHSFALSGDVEMVMETDQVYSGEGHELAFTSRQEFEGEVTYEIEVD